MSHKTGRSVPAWRTMLAYGWRFALAGPPIGTGVIILPAMILSLAEPQDVVGAWLWFSIFGYLFALPVAGLAGLFYGATQHDTPHPSRWLLGGLCGVLAWEAQCWAATLWWHDPDSLQGLIILPVPALAGAVCARLFAPAASPPPHNAAAERIARTTADTNTPKP
ncbi:hypothetical protein V5738_18505 [Salinisphaera sp. SPP-AMP-43]|uniref:hypothetical protein n=1 Tax=Salinisphaera sp. SPP-AMP-43 TaxID=3121288 RepID=UPI003C6E41E4